MSSWSHNAGVPGARVPRGGNHLPAGARVPDQMGGMAPLEVRVDAAVDDRGMHQVYFWRVYIIKFAMNMYEHVMNRRASTWWSSRCSTRSTSRSRAGSPSASAGARSPSSTSSSPSSSTCCSLSTTTRRSSTSRSLRAGERWFLTITFGFPTHQFFSLTANYFFRFGNLSSEDTVNFRVEVCPSSQYELQ